MVDQLGTGAAMVPATPAAVGQAPASDLARLLNEAAQQVLPPRMAAAFWLRYGLDRGRYRTLAQVGSELGITRERARQLTTTAVGRLRRRGRFEQARGLPLGPCGLLVAQAEALVGDLAGAAMPTRVLEQLWDQLRFLPPKVGARLLLALAGMPWPETATAAGAVYEVLQRQLRARAEYQRTERAAQAQLLRQRRFERFLVDSTIWFGPPQLVRQLGGFRAARQVRPEVAVAHHSPKLDRLVACESTLEAGFYRFLDQAEVVWTYQEQPVSIPLVVDGAQRRYHPDVLVVLVDGRVVLAELKPRLQWALFDNLRKWAALADCCRQHGYGMFIGDCHRALQQTLAASPPEDFTRSLLALADRGGAGWGSCRRLLAAHGATSRDLTAVVLAHGLELRVQPFVLRRLWGPAGDEVRQFLGLLRAGLQANAAQARLAARLRATER
jgi:hypothetical protein